MTELYIPSRSTPVNRLNEITLEMSKSEFRAIISMISDNATLIGTADSDFADRTIKNVRKTNRMLKRNRIKTEIKY